ncbi:MAG: glycosyltransferase family 2 protein [Actinomycetota bacterium]
MDRGPVQPEADAEATIVITNHNYASFLPEALESALAQTDPRTSVVAVDDGSSDASSEVLARYENRVQVLLQEKKGQSAAMNAGFAASRGDIVVFLDADDLIDPDTVETAIRHMGDKVVKVSWPLRVIDRHGHPNGEVKPPHELGNGDQLDALIEFGPDNLAWAPTSGNAWRRTFLDSVMPLPEPELGMKIGSASADAYLSMLAPLFGEVSSIPRPSGCYRVHGDNDHSAMSFPRRLTRDLQLFDMRTELLERFCRERGIAVDPSIWRARSGFYRLQRAVTELKKLVDPGETFALIDDGVWGRDVHAVLGSVPFLEREGIYWGPPADDASAIEEVKKLLERNITIVAIAWTSFWWLKHYPGFASVLNERGVRLHESDVLRVFSLDPSLVAAPRARGGRSFSS